MTTSEKPDTEVADAQQLRALVGEVHLLAERKVLDRLDHFCRDFIALSPFLVLASSDSEGRADASPRGDGPGFVRALYANGARAVVVARAATGCGGA